jgi:hypothetical protein
MEADRTKRDAEAAEWARLDERVDQAAAFGLDVLPAGVGAALAAMLEAMKPFRASDGHMSSVMVSRSSPEVLALAEALLAAQPPPPASEAERVLAETFRKIAAGRREYAEGAPDNQRDVLLTQAAAFDNAAEIASGSDRPLYGLLPSWRWTEEMTTRVEAAQQRLAERDEGLERG